MDENNGQKSFTSENKQILGAIFYLREIVHDSVKDNLLFLATWNL